MMTKIDNINTGNLGKLERRVEALERSLNLASSSVERGRMRFYDGSELLIQDSNLNVVGTATIRGTLRADGTIAFTGTLTQSGSSTFTGDTSFDGPTDVAGDFTVTGPTKLNGVTDIGGNTSVTGDLTVTGPTKLNGKTDIGGNTKVTGTMDVEGPMGVTGTLDIKGRSTLQDDLDVMSGGRIKVGNMALDPSVGSGALTFVNGSQVFTNGDSIQMLRGNGVVQVTGDRAALQWGGVGFSVDAGGRKVSNLPQTTQKPNVYVDANGYLYRSTAV